MKKRWKKREGALVIYKQHFYPKSCWRQQHPPTVIFLLLTTGEIDMILKKGKLWKRRFMCNQKEVNISPKHSAVYMWMPIHTNFYLNHWKKMKWSCTDSFLMGTIFLLFFSIYYTFTEKGEKMKKINIVKRQMAHKKQWKFSSLRLKLLLWFLWQEPIYQKIKLIQPFTSLFLTPYCALLKRTLPRSYQNILSYHFESTFKERKRKILLSYYTSNMILLLLYSHKLN